MLNYVEFSFIQNTVMVYSIYTLFVVIFRNLGYRIMIVGISSDINEVLFNNIASEPASLNFIQLPYYSSLNMNHQKIMSQVCSNDFRDSVPRAPEPPVFLSGKICYHSEHQYYTVISHSGGDGKETLHQIALIG